MEQQPSILLVDDNEEFRGILSVKLEKAGFLVHTAGNGKEAVLVAPAIHPDLIILDLEMPLMNGMEALFAMRNLPELRHTRFVFLTTHGDPSEDTGWINDKYAREAGARDFIRKTDDLDVIVDQVKRNMRI